MPGGPETLTLMKLWRKEQEKLADAETAIEQKICHKTIYMKGNIFVLTVLLLGVHAGVLGMV